MVLARSPTEGMTAEELAIAVSAAPEEIPPTLDHDPEVTKVGELYALAREVEAANERLLGALRRRAQQRPESPELSVAEARAATGLAPRLADALLEKLAAGGEILASDPGVSLPGAQVTPSELEERAQRLLEELRLAGTEPPTMEQTPELRLLLKRGEVVELGGRLYVAREAADKVLEEIKTACREEGEISLAGLRDRLGTSRKYAQAWLEYSDAAGVTSRTGDFRVLTRRYR
jgi:selenocysteine-specific elongation factor